MNQNSAAGDPPNPLWPPKVSPGSPQSDPKSTRKLACPSVFRPQSPPVPRFCHPVFGFFQAVSILYRYCIDTVPIQYRYSIDIACKNPKTGSQNRATGASGVGKPKHRRALGSILGRFGGILGWLWGVRERSGEAAGGRKKNVHFLGFKIMKLCGDLSLLLIRPELL